MAVVGVMVAAVVGFYLTTPTNRDSGQAGTLPTHLGSPTHFGHPLIATSSGALSGAAAISLSCPLAASQCLGSYNWGGYVVYNTSFSVTKVVGSWTVPAISGATSTTCPDAQMTWDSNAVWVGIDGAFTNTVEQTGTSSDCFYGQTSYYGWYEFYPAGSVLVPFTISPGNHITASVSFTGNNATGVPTFTTTLKDTTTSTSYTSPKTAVPGALRESAEWIDESPYYYGFLGLTHVSLVTFTGASATINGVTKSISGWGASNVYWIVMGDYNLPSDYVITYVKAEPGKLNSAGTGFSVTWVSSGP